MRELRQLSRSDWSTFAKRLEEDTTAAQMGEEMAADFHRLKKEAETVLKDIDKRDRRGLLLAWESMLQFRRLAAEANLAVRKELGHRISERAYISLIEQGSTHLKAIFETYLGEEEGNSAGAFHTESTERLVVEATSLGTEGGESYEPTPGSEG